MTQNIVLNAVEPVRMLLSRRPIHGATLVVGLKKRLCGLPVESCNELARRAVQALNLGEKVAAETFQRNS